jgi:hypothetical protein
MYIPPLIPFYLSGGFFIALECWGLSSVVGVANHQSQHMRLDAGHTDINYHCIGDIEIRIYI